jgi:putative phosphonate metabolism protein
MSQARFAVYFTPVPGSRLARFGAAVLGYDCDSGAEVPRLRFQGVDPDAMAQATGEPARYGFHATLVAPFEPAAGRSGDELIAALEDCAAAQAPVSLGRLTVARIGRFIALVPSGPTPVAELERACLAQFDGLRAPLSTADRARRIAAGLTPAQTALLDRWGYPYVLAEFRFHMTLAGPLAASNREPWRARLAEAFANLADEPVTIDGISLVCQRERRGKFRVLTRRPLTG